MTDADGFSDISRLWDAAEVGVGRSESGGGRIVVYSKVKLL
jgi:hypothetical protein